MVPVWACLSSCVRGLPMCPRLQSKQEIEDEEAEDLLQKLDKRELERQQAELERQQEAIEK